VPMESVIEFKRDVYRLALNELVVHLGSSERTKHRAQVAQQTTSE
jgi:putative (di)nucleoside polyphosphate hydrolase